MPRRQGFRKTRHLKQVRTSIPPELVERVKAAKSKSSIIGLAKDIYESDEAAKNDAA